MGRYKPPRQRGSKYITPEGEQVLRDELHQLWKVERPVVTNTVHEAAKNGDRSENGDYIYGKRRLREIDSRVRFLNTRLDELEVVLRPPDNTQTPQIESQTQISMKNSSHLPTNFYATLFENPFLAFRDSPCDSAGTSPYR